MTSKQRVKKAIHFQGPDHVPHYLPDGQENDILWLWPDRPPALQEWTMVDGTDQRRDCWGVLWVRPHGRPEFGEAKEYPIQHITRQHTYEFPDCNNDMYLAGIAEKIQKNASSNNPKYCLGVLPFSSLNEGTHNIMGLAEMFVAYHEHPDDLKALIGRLADGQRESIRKLAAIGCDGVMGYDDWGLQDRLMVRPEIIEEFFMPHYRANWGYARELGMEVWLHSCGHIMEALPLCIDAGLHVIQMDQQEQIGLDVLNNCAGGKICFWCPVDVQKTMVKGTPQQVRDYVRHMIETIGSHNGGLISMAYSTPDAVGHRQENTQAMCEAFREYGGYDRSRT